MLCGMEGTDDTRHGSRALELTKPNKPNFPMASWF